MKKFFILTALAATAMMGFTACEDDKDPVLQKPAEGSFVLNEPVFANEQYVLTPGGSMVLTTSQPDYGFTASVTYSVELRLTDGGEIKTIKPETPTDAMIRLSDESVSAALCELLAVEDEGQLAELCPLPVEMRAVAQIESYENTRIESNWVTFKSVTPYFAVPTPGFIYLAGSPGGWTAPEAQNEASFAEWRLFEPTNAIGSQIYTGVFNIPAGDVYFRFYTALEGWDKNSWGPNEDSGVEKAEDNGAYNVIYDWDFEGEFSQPMEECKNNFVFKGWTGGEMTLTVDFSGKAPILTVQAGSHQTTITKYVYMVGNNGGWAEPSGSAYDDWRLADSNESGVYTGTFDMAGFSADGGTLYCRFYQELTGWGAAQWSSDPNGGNVDVVLGQPMPTFQGEGCFVVADVTDKTVSVSLDTNANTVTFNVE